MLLHILWNSISLKAVALQFIYSFLFYLISLVRSHAPHKLVSRVVVGIAFGMDECELLSAHTVHHRSICHGKCRTSSFILNFIHSIGWMICGRWLPAQHCSANNLQFYFIIRKKVGKRKRRYIYAYGEYSQYTLFVVVRSLCDRFFDGQWAMGIRIHSTFFLWLRCRHEMQVQVCGNFFILCFLRARHVCDGGGGGGEQVEPWT